MNTPTELRAKSQRIQHEARAKLETIAEDGSNAAAVEAEFDRMLADADALEARAKRYEDLEAREAALNVADARRPSEDRSIKSGTREERESEAWTAYVNGRSTSEQRALLTRAQSVGTQSEGGYLVPTRLASEIIVSMKAYGPMMDPGFVRVISSASGESVNWPTFDNTANKCVAIAENAQASDANVAFGSKPLNVSKYKAGVIKIPTELLQDASFDVSGIVNSAIAEQFGRGLNEVLTTGTNGIATLAAVGKTAASATALTAEDLIDLVHSVDRAYRVGGTFQFNDDVMRAARKLKDSTGQFLWQPGLQAGEAGSLLGYRFEINPDMASPAAAAKVALFGQHGRYINRQVGGLEIKRLVERYADYDQVGFVSFWRVGGNLMDAGAVKALRMA